MKESGWFWDLLAERYDKQTPKDENYAGCTGPAILDTLAMG